MICWVAEYFQFPPNPEDTRSAQGMRRLQSDKQETIAILWTTWECNTPYSGRQIRDVGDDVKRKIVTNLQPKWLDEVDADGMPPSGKTFDDVLESVRVACFVEDKLAKMREAAIREAKKDIESLVIADPVERAAAQERIKQEKIDAIVAPSPVDCPLSYEPFGWLAFKLFSYYGNRTLELPMFDMLLASNAGADAAVQPAGGGSRSSRGRRG
jgi:hypothetical protein